MKASLLREMTLYRYRYVIAYGLFAVLLVTLLTIDLSNLPYGVSNSEMNSAVASNSLNPLSPRIADIVNFPYHILQKISIGLLGLSTLSIRLPSVILGLIAGLVLAIMMNTWFRRNVAIISLMIATFSVPFISSGRLGVPTIMYTLLLLITLLSAVKLTTKSKHAGLWKLFLLTSALLLLYVPFGVYTLLALVIAGALHPHIRYQLTHTSKVQATLLSLLALLLIAPIVIASIFDHGVFKQLFGLTSIEQSLQPHVLKETVVSLLKTLFLFSRPNAGETVSPFLNLTFALFIAFGLIKVIIDHHAARSYLLLIWLAFTVCMLLIDPGQLPLLFVPSILLLAIGIETFISEWYKLFPRNPYARIGALVPITLIFVGLIAIAITRYFYAYTYSDTSSAFHPELRHIQKEVKSTPAMQLVVPSSQQSFYDILRAKNDRLSVVTPNEIATNGRRLVLASAQVSVNELPKKIVTSPMKTDAVLYRIYDTAKQ